MTQSEYMRDYRARRKASGAPCPSGSRSGLDTRDRVTRVVDPMDYGHPASDVRLGP